jgi:hypothetical protein
MIAVAGLLLGAGCASMDDVRSDRTCGTTLVVEGSRTEVLKAAVAVLRQQGVETLKQDADEGAVFGTMPESTLGDVSSTYCGVWIEEASIGIVQVRGGDSAEEIPVAPHRFDGVDVPRRA